MAVFHLNGDALESVSLYQFHHRRSAVVDHQEVCAALGERLKNPGVLDFAVRIEPGTSSLPASGIGRIDDNPTGRIRRKQSQKPHTVAFVERDLLGESGNVLKSLPQRGQVPPGANAVAVLRQRGSGNEDAASPGPIQHLRLEAMLVRAAPAPWSPVSQQLGG